VPVGGLGYYFDNELYWGESWHSDQGLLSLHFATEPGAPGRIPAIHDLRSTYETIEEMNRALDANLSSWAELAELRDLGPHIAMAQRAIQSASCSRDGPLGRHREHESEPLAAWGRTR